VTYKEQKKFGNSGGAREKKAQKGKAAKDPFQIGYEGDRSVAIGTVVLKQARDRTRKEPVPPKRTQTLKRRWNVANDRESNIQSI